MDSYLDFANNRLVLCGSVTEQNYSAAPWRQQAVIPNVYDAHAVMTESQSHVFSRSVTFELLARNAQAMRPTGASRGASLEVRRPVVVLMQPKVGRILDPNDTPIGMWS